MLRLHIHRFLRPCSAPTDNTLHLYVDSMTLIMVSARINRGHATTTQHQTELLELSCKFNSSNIFDDAALTAGA